MQPPAQCTTGAQIVSQVENAFKRYVALVEGLFLVLALWVLATHFFDCFDAFPYLAITSPTKRCGKTRLGEVIEIFSSGPLRTAGATGAAIFRTIQLLRANGRTVTLIMDEAELLSTKSDRADLIREIFNAGYRRGQKMLRCEAGANGQFKPREFEVYCPKVVILIGTLHDTLADRCIPITMRRRMPNERVERFFHASAKQDAKPLLKDLKEWADANQNAVQACMQRDLEFLQDREAELWLPLFAVCELAAPGRLKELKRIALRISQTKCVEDTADAGILLLRDIKAIFDRKGEERLATKCLLDELQATDESPWAEWNNGWSLDARALARLLRPFRIAPQNVRIEEGVVKGYVQGDFREAWEAYVPAPLAATPLQDDSAENCESSG